MGMLRAAIVLPPQRDTLVQEGKLASRRLNRINHLRTVWTTLAEILDPRRLQGTLEAAIHSLPSTLRHRLGRKDPLFSKHLWEAPKLLSQLR